MRQRGEAREAALADARRALDRDALQLGAVLTERLRAHPNAKNVQPALSEHRGNWYWRVPRAALGGTGRVGPGTTLT